MQPNDIENLDQSFIDDGQKNNNDWTNLTNFYGTCGINIDNFIISADSTVQKPDMFDSQPPNTAERDETIFKIHLICFIPKMIHQYRIPISAQKCKYRLINFKILFINKKF